MATLVTTSLRELAANNHPGRYPTYYRTTTINGLSIFYREAGPKEGATILLLTACRHLRACSSRCLIALPGTTTW